MNQPTVLIVEDDVALSSALGTTLEIAGYAVDIATDGFSALERIKQALPEIVVSDVQMEGMNGHELLKNIKAHHLELPVILMTAYGTIEMAVDAMRSGAADYLVKPFDADVLVNMISRYLPLVEVNTGIVAEDIKTQRLAILATRVAGSEATVMISGESGTGKEVFAQLIHEKSSRNNGPFIAINCAAIPENMLESSLFGYEKGAFTGAYQARAGKFEQAQGGTLLLDEISEMDLGLQAKLLRVLQEREVERLGGNTVVKLDVRVLATTNRRIREEVAAGRFREDLFYRLNVFPLHLPPLRERTADILPLAERLINNHYVEGQGYPCLTKKAEQALLQHQWPGNVRELDNVIQRALILLEGDHIEAEHLQFEPEQYANSIEQELDAEHDEKESGLGNDLKNREYQLIVEALEADAGNRKVVADKLGISPRTLRYKLAKMREQGIAIPA
ncbi:MAG: sigma-54 dependent transcriptional regulator [Gammaproteobacteria bacterium]